MQFINVCSTKLLILLAGICLFSQAVWAEVQQATVRVPVASMLTKPRQSAAVDSQAVYGTRVAILSRARNDFIQVQTPDGFRGWMRMQELSGHLLSRGHNRAEVNDLFALVYRDMDTTKHEPLLMLPFGTMLNVVAEPRKERNRWLKVQLVDGGSGYIQRASVRLNPQPLSMWQMLSLSKRFVGIPYRWGGRSTFGYDCSGFVQMLYAQMGIHIPRDATPQTKWRGFIKVAKQNLRPGDIIYFKQQGKITHAAIYLGNGKIIGATTYRGPTVHIGRLNDPWWTKIYAMSRRLRGSGV